jgi:hypothetical protein
MRRIRDEKLVLDAMIVLFCKKTHNASVLCDDCQQLLQYGIRKLDLCVFGNLKPVCSKCHAHCYNRVMREKIGSVMRFSGPRIVYYHPYYFFRHFINRLNLG